MASYASIGLLTGFGKGVAQMGETLFKQHLIEAESKRKAHLEELRYKRDRADKLTDADTAHERAKELKEMDAGNKATRLGDVSKEYIKTWRDDIKYAQEQLNNQDIMLKPAERTELQNVIRDRTSKINGLLANAGRPAETGATESIADTGAADTGAGAGTGTDPGESSLRKTLTSMFGDRQPGVRQPGDRPPAITSGATLVPAPQGTPMPDDTPGSEYHVSNLEALTAVGRDTVGNVSKRLGETAENVGGWLGETAANVAEKAGGLLTKPVEKADVTGALRRMDAALGERRGITEEDAEQLGVAARMLNEGELSLDRIPSNVREQVLQQSLDLLAEHFKTNKWTTPEQDDLLVYAAEELRAGRLSIKDIPNELRNFVKQYATD